MLPGRATPARRRADATVYDAACVRTSFRARRRRAFATGHGPGCVARAPGVRDVSGSVVSHLVAADRRRDREPLRRVRVDGRAAVSVGAVVDPVGVAPRDVAVVRAQRVRARRGRPELGDLRPQPWDRRLPADRGVRTTGFSQRAHAAGARAGRMGRVSGVPPADLAVLARGSGRPALRLLDLHRGAHGRPREPRHGLPGPACGVSGDPPHGGLAVTDRVRGAAHRRSALPLRGVDGGLRHDRVVRADRVRAGAGVRRTASRGPVPNRAADRRRLPGHRAALAPLPDHGIAQPTDRGPPPGRSDRGRPRGLGGAARAHLDRRRTVHVDHAALLGRG